MAPEPFFLAPEPFFLAPEPKASVFLYLIPYIYSNFAAVVLRFVIGYLQGLHNFETNSEEYKIEILYTLFLKQYFSSV